jgi:hypothetical protein
MLGLVVGLPGVVGAAIFLKALGVLQEDTGFDLLIIGWAIAWTFLAFRLVQWPCPRCTKSWLSGQEPFIAAERRCSVCGLVLYEAA